MGVRQMNCKITQVVIKKKKKTLFNAQVVMKIFIFGKKKNVVLYELITCIQYKNVICNIIIYVTHQS